MRGEEEFVSYKCVLYATWRAESLNNRAVIIRSNTGDRRSGLIEEPVGRQPVNHPAMSCTWRSH